MKTETLGTYLRAVKQLARWHAEGEDGITIYVLPDPDEREVRLVEVSDAFPRADNPRAITIGATPDFPYTSGTLCITRAQVDQVREGEMALPDGWQWDGHKQVWPID